MKFNLNNIKLRNKSNNNDLLVRKNNYFFPKFTFLILFTIITIGFIACEKIIVNEIPSEYANNNIPKVEQISLGSSFDDIILNSNIEVELIHSECKSVVIETIIDSNLECSSYKNTNKTANNSKQIQTNKPKIYLNNKSLIIEDSKSNNQKIQTLPFLNLKNNNNQSKNNIYSTQYLTKYKVYIYTPNIRNLSINGNGKIISKDEFSNAKNDIFLDGNGKIDLDINSENLNIQSRGNGLITLSGNVQKIEMNIIGDNNVMLSNLIAENSSIILGGNSNLEINVHNKLKIDIFGNSKVYLIKNPKILESDITGNGFIRKY